MNTYNIDPLSYVKDAIDIFHILHNENKKGYYNGKLEAFNHVLANKLMGQSISLFFLRKNGIEYEFEGEKFKLLDSTSAINIFRGILETYLTWSHIYSPSNSENQKKAKFILWNLEGLRSINQFANTPNLIDLFKNLNGDTQDDTISLEKQLNQNLFFMSLDTQQKEKLRKVDSKNINKVKTYNWKFIFNERSKKLKIYSNILPYIKDFFGDYYHDLYKYTSMYVHSSYPSASQLYRNDSDKFSALKVINSLNHSSFQILCLGIKDLLHQNPSLQEIFDRELQEHQIFKAKYFSSLKWFENKIK